ncbi:hypothetical protein [Halodesulfovibrio sp.]|uniref:hypothetical protein n=1 Tax=Halodesulfovibrio sp. TaxID=1912772 RepID=UPI0025E5ADFD|nr:hypothetical protein [Halodesulfovibrio sp.]MCT4627504.1 hypothetical protein [Halodesulfovibrio sp.]
MMAAMLPPQLDFQSNFSRNHVARMNYLFCNSPHFEKYFTEKYQITPQLFAEMQVAISTMDSVIDVNKRSAHIKILNSAKFSLDEIVKFYSALCKTPHELTELLKDHAQKAKSKLYKLNDRSPIMNYPFLLAENKLSLISYHALQSSVSNYFFNEVKSYGNDDVSDELAKKFEQFL